MFATAGVGGKSAKHAHHALHLVVAVRGTVRIAVEGASRAAPALVTAPDVPHEIDAEGKETILVFVDPESDEGERLRAAIVHGSAGPYRIFDARTRDAWIARLPRPAAPDAFDAWARAVVAEAAAHPEGPPRPRAHPRVRKLIAYLKVAPADADTSIAALASEVGLSESRLTHAFRASVGISLRAYLLWLKLQRAVVAMTSGRSLAHAAAEGGFADAAHMSRTFRRMFGMSATGIRASLPRADRPSGLRGGGARGAR